MRNSGLRAEQPRAAKFGSAEEREPREVMDIRQAAEYLGISTDSLYRYAAEGTLPGFRLGNRWRFKRSRLNQWMDEQSGPSAQPQAKPNPTRKKPVRAVR